MKPDFFLATVIKELLNSTQIDPQLVDDVHIGNVLMPGAGAIPVSSATAKPYPPFPQHSPTIFPLSFPALILFFLSLSV